jgi:hypothetical protein
MTKSITEKVSTGIVAFFRACFQTTTVTKDDRLAIARYLKSIPPVKNKVVKP